MLTINADSHTVMNQFHKPTDEKRMVVILPDERYAAWLSAPAEQSMEFMVPFGAGNLVAQTVAAR